MPKSLKLKSFTLLELLVSLLVSAILMALTLYALNSFQKLNHIYGLQQQTLFRLMTLHRLLIQDFSKSQVIKRTRFGIVVLNKDNVIEYSFPKEDFIIRKQGKETEEFEFEASDLQLLYKDKPTYLYDEVIDEMRFIIQIEDEVLPFHFIKSYAANILMENELREK